jgi:hypothetical protein
MCMSLTCGGKCYREHLRDQHSIQQSSGLGLTAANTAAAAAAAACAHASFRVHLDAVRCCKTSVNRTVL